ncbi:DUF4124 domain-containing protein [Pseudomonas sp. JM0905a]|uniref:DUF4124 domain-containing protein n=1 Tax=Metapseudomonas resinovorans TaxID=53412 RepID=A0ABT4XXY4_METRE|nr:MULTISPECIES: DUF4124 domain-containing protein [Pseudomonas]MBD2837280.1 DUF4124 domain-containing protein [Pseudomonas sp. JM0905a]MDA8481445.1 DUF4124 domain-containing protein [Pseudomonas resinovorans]
MIRFLLLALLLLGQPVLAEVYTYIDEEGNRVFTDQPKPGNAKRLEIAPAPNEMNAPRDIQPPPLYPKPIPREQGYQVLRILVPEPDATIRDGEGNLIVSAMSEPGLRGNHSYRLLLDGQPMGEPGRSPVFPLKNLDRGTHQLAVEIVDEQGRVVERTPGQPVHIVRMSLSQKRLARPCKKDDYGVRPECPLKDKPKDEDEDDIAILPFI